ncbi:hypothetical protein FA15DRAFT_696753 [Coprinopsis marcescibilis]|uniref:Uncharacterized protein n=1 Tax=Coprinopsis marcescibilis TaxID=230819 RepID=A0A5C3KLD3_COPMA|nr:hypothetical protein FA15DRAFT_696753 [Coprinopsis marcescibilis]
MQFTIGALVSVAVMLSAQAVSAVDLRFYHAGNCAGGFGSCNNIGSGVCCIAGGVPGASVQAVGGGVGTTFAYGTQACHVGPVVSAGGGSCVRPSFAAFASRWTSPGFTRREATEGGPCAELDTFGFTNDNGDEVSYKIPDERRASIVAALAKGDDAALKASADGLTPVSA